MSPVVETDIWFTPWILRLLLFFVLFLLLAKIWDGLPMNIQNFGHSLAMILNFRNICVTLIFLGRVNLARALQNSPYQIQSCLTASFEARGSLLCVTFPDFLISPHGGAISVVKY